MTLQTTIAVTCTNSVFKVDQKYFNRSTIKSYTLKLSVAHFIVYTTYFKLQYN